MKITLITLFPDMIHALDYGVIQRAIQRQQVQLQTINPRDFAIQADGRIDDRPYGGGPGMVMQYEPLKHAIEYAKSTLPTAPVIHLSPQGQPLKQHTLQQWADGTEFIFLCSRYEGIDARLSHYIDEEVSIGDYVLSGGELPALVCLDGLIRLLPGVLGHEDSAAEDSFSCCDDGQRRLDAPHYTRPRVWHDRQTPEVLLSGDHEAVASWRHDARQTRTVHRRPDLLDTESSVHPLKNPN